MLRILIADDLEIIRSGIRLILTDEFPDISIGEAADTDSLIEKGLAGEWDLIISDLSMPGAGGSYALIKILEQQPLQRILIVSMYSEDQYAAQMKKLGASGYINKDAVPEQLITVVKEILSDISGL